MAHRETFMIMPMALFSPYTHSGTRILWHIHAVLLTSLFWIWQVWIFLNTKNSMLYCRTKYGGQCKMQSYTPLSYKKPQWCRSSFICKNRNSTTKQGCEARLKLPPPRHLTLQLLNLVFLKLCEGFSWVFWSCGNDLRSNGFSENKNLHVIQNNAQLVMFAAHYCKT